VSDLYTDLADVYDAVFEWDISDEAAWLAARLGPGCRRVLEPGCGAGRMFGPLAAHGLAVTGIDSSPQMVELARRRGNGEAVLADMTDFDIGLFDGAVCPINTLGHLSPAELDAHLAAMSRALVPGARYLVQLAIGAEVGVESRWEVDRAGARIRASWLVESRDLERGTELHRSVFEMLEGLRAGERHEQLHEMTYWTSETWGAAVAASPLEWVASYDGAEAGRPQVGFDAVGGLLWHELLRP
jgi:SAM-dependent methyltransferase